ncbi:hypothetical protein A2U01_0023573, partial [Trifolium medium]|nr:hypothetical protein [Trifolium medium]
MFAYQKANGSDKQVDRFPESEHMENTSKDRDRGKHTTKESASAKKEKAAQNPPKKRSRKPPAQS